VIHRSAEDKTGARAPFAVIGAFGKEHHQGAAFDHPQSAPSESCFWVKTPRYHLESTQPKGPSLVCTPFKSTGHIPIIPERTLCQSLSERLIHSISTAYKEVKAQIVKAFQNILAGPPCHLEVTASRHQNHPASYRKL